MRVYGYVRVSTEEQATRGQSLAAQEEKIRLYCTLHELELAELIVDAGYSAKTLRRPGLIRALAGLKSGEAAGLVIVKLDRLSRSVRDWAALIEGTFGPAGAALLSVGDSIDTRTAGGRLVLHILGAVSEWERAANGERVKAVQQHKVARGEPISRPPRGLRIVGRSFVPDPQEARLVARARQLRAAGETFAGIAERLSAEGARSAAGTELTHGTVRRWITNQRPELVGAA
jgi:DNA invertase Pin-like site-specific DNA recombinase